MLISDSDIDKEMMMMMMMMMMNWWWKYEKRTQPPMTLTLALPLLLLPLLLLQRNQYASLCFLLFFCFAVSFSFSFLFLFYALPLFDHYAYLDYRMRIHHSNFEVMVESKQCWCVDNDDLCAVCTIDTVWSRGAFQSCCVIQSRIKIEHTKTIFFWSTPPSLSLFAFFFLRNNQIIYILLFLLNQSPNTMRSNESDANETTIRTNRRLKLERDYLNWNVLVGILSPI